ncbi:hypothetical protein N7G274_005937 [Stereocaulon virgatum]|uniref:Protein kinase domain-containing protein n=1 Tax=Stereocaulon virgatum TaxID=373712 RepID=A0ABR4A6W8_9LECA
MFDILSPRSKRTCTMEALSPRSANIQVKPRLMKQKELVEEEDKKADAAKKALKEKEYAPVPPEWVLQPPIAKGGLAEKFRTGRCIGKGGFAMCYEGELRSKQQGMNKTIFALKVVKAKMSQKKMEEKFRTELQIHAKMQHPNIVEFHRAFTYQESTYVVLELCSNGSVMDMVKKRRCLSLPEVRRYTVQLCGAIKYMHARNVIHRDLKMGNLFLDQEMNLKIGDFGLAAVLVSKEEYQLGLYENAKKRRTTLCGTPNYIAPEILEKGKGGHDYKVDIWAIGVIVFAMISGQPPFQSASQNEIYRRARSLEYDWPQKDKHFNDIPDEVKDLVAQLLKVDAEERPDADQIVSHPFFSMHGGDAMPLVMEESFTREIPQFLDQRTRPRGDVMIKGTERLSLRRLASRCGVGHFAGDREPLAAVGGDLDIPLFGQCQAEELSGKAPVVPMPNDTVYTSKFATMSPRPQKSGSSTFTEPDTLIYDSLQPQVTSEGAVQFSVPERARRVPVQSHAATLRASHCSSIASQSRPTLERANPNSGIVRSREAATASLRGQRGLLNELPVRPTINASNPGGLEAKTLARNPRAARAKKVHVLDDEQAPSSTDTIEIHKPFNKNRLIDEVYPNLDARRRDMSARTRARITSNVQREMAAPEHVVDKPSLGKPASRRGQVSDSVKPGNALIGPDDVPECLPNTKPDDVLHQLQNLHDELERCLSDFSEGKDNPYDQDVDAKNRSFKQRPVVVRWVDYTNKFGIGYILANGTVGCVFKGDETSFPTCVVVAGAETHLKRRKVAGYAERNQMVPSKGSPIEFIENCDEDGLKRVLVQSSTYQVKVADGVADRLSPGRDVYDFEKRKKLCLWDKFGKYMTQSLGKSDEGDLPALEESNVSKSRRNNIAGPFVKFYQRLGNVGIWGYGDGSFQFNFPDHTKLVISEGGSWLDFYHLPFPAAKKLKSGGILEPGDLAERSVLCYPTSIMLSGSYRGHDFKDLMKENELDVKMTFIRDVVGVWAIEGGLGCMGRKKGVRWDGMMEKGGKLVWVTVGAKGGDGRYEMPVAKV